MQQRSDCNGYARSIIVIDLADKRSLSSGVSILISQCLAGPDKLTQKNMKKLSVEGIHATVLGEYPES